MKQLEVKINQSFISLHCFSLQAGLQLCVENCISDLVIFLFGILFVGGLRVQQGQQGFNQQQQQGLPDQRQLINQYNQFQQQQQQGGDVYINQQHYLQQQQALREQQEYERQRLLHERQQQLQQPQQRQQNFNVSIQNIY